VTTTTTRTKFAAENIFFTGLIRIGINFTRYALKVVKIWSFVKVLGSVKGPWNGRVNAFSRRDIQLNEKLLLAFRNFTGLSLKILKIRQIR